MTPLHMPLGDFIQFIILGLLGLSTLIEISPLKINPWRWIAKQIGKTINEEVLSQVEDLKEDIDSMRDDMKHMKHVGDERAAKTARRQILRFGDEILHGLSHSKDSFDDILLLSTEYEQYCRAHPEFKNNMTVRVMELINKTYDKCLEENNFD